MVAMLRVIVMKMWMAMVAIGMRMMVAMTSSPLAVVAMSDVRHLDPQSTTVASDEVPRPCDHEDSCRPTADSVPNHGYRGQPVRTNACSEPRLPGVTCQK